MSKIKAIRARAFLVPMKKPLRTATSEVTRFPIVLIDVETTAGITGHAYLFGVQPVALRSLVQLAVDLHDALGGHTTAPADVERTAAQRFRTFRIDGHLAMVLSGIDIALWDIAAKGANLPLCDLLGGSVGPVTAYEANGLSLRGADRLSDEASVLAAQGFAAIKLRLGYATIGEDLAAVDAVSKEVHGRAQIVVDFNQGLAADEALRRCAELDQKGLAWIEEPMRCDDYAAHAALRRRIRTPLMLGESFWGPRDMLAAVKVGACDLVMPDLMRIGGVSGWLRAAAVAHAYDIPMGSHLFPEVSAHLMRVTPTAKWLEYVDWAAAALAEPLSPTSGVVTPSKLPGVGLSWNEHDLKGWAA